MSGQRFTYQTRVLPQFYQARPEPPLASYAPPRRSVSAVFAFPQHPETRPTAASAARRSSLASCRSQPRLAAHRTNRADCFGVIERNILPRLKHPHFADLLRRNAARRQIRHTAIAEFQPHIGDIHLRRKNRNSRRANLRLVSARASASTISRSWIIRSSTTSTSRLRSVNTLIRWISKNSGSVAIFPVPQLPD